MTSYYNQQSHMQSRNEKKKSKFPVFRGHILSLMKQFNYSQGIFRKKK